jgi:hypothetical protein
MCEFTPMRGEKKIVIRVWYRQAACVTHVWYRQAACVTHVWYRQVACASFLGR